MNPNDELWVRADRILDGALDLPRSERAAFLESACGGDAELRALVERLLSSAESEDTELEPGGAMQGPLWERLHHELSSEDEPPPGTVVGKYRLVRELGRGGMAVVYLAERADGQFRQQVALKLLRGGFAASQIARRFEQEAQILAQARHPGISRLLDGGADAGGRPYLVMELVDGLPIDRYCDEEQLPVPERLRLFLQVARAVEDAHRNLIVHRDLKPTNILVTAEGHAKLLDFGIAKLLAPTADAPVSLSSIRLMTPAYASPEQVRGEPVTAASDIYQLGLLLYVLLCGRFPYDLGEPGSRLRAIAQQVPVRPSQCLSSPESCGIPPGHDPHTAEEIARCRGTTPARLRRALTGDLDAIVLTALRKEPEERYGSVTQLIADIERHLLGRTVAARPDTWAYRAGKLLRRHAAGALAAVLAVTLVLLLGLVYTLRLARERDEALRQAQRSARASEFLQELFEVPPEQANSLTARQLLDRGLERVEADLAGQPELQADLLVLLGGLYRELGYPYEAQGLVVRAAALRAGAAGAVREPR